MERITMKAMAKINLGLDVLRKREDGYHEVRMIMQTVDIYDTITIIRENSSGASGRADILIETDDKRIPAGRSNLIYRAAELFMQQYGIREGVRIILNKRIPMAAGMAGGSTDAAAVFVGMNRLFNMARTEEELRGLAVRIGADVPYCIMGGTALAEGIGEKLTRLPDVPSCALVIAKPDIGVSTQFVYGNLRADELEQHPDIDGMIKAVREGSLQGVAARLGNVLETVTVPAYPVIEEIKEFLKGHGAVNVLMSGSGPTVFGIYESRETAEGACEELKKAGFGGYAVTALPARETCVEESE